MTFSCTELLTSCSNGSTMTSKKYFWRTFFGQVQISKHLADIAAQGEQGRFFLVFLPEYGNVTFTCRSASEKGDGFFSNTYTIKASPSNGKTFEAFIKVIRGFLSKMGMIESSGTSLG